MNDTDEPREDDYVTTDHVHFYQDGKLVLTVAEGEDMEVAVLRHMDEERFWPDVYWLSDHGNAHRIELSKPV